MGERRKFNDADFARDMIYWNNYYTNKLAVNEPSLFALFVCNKYLYEDASLLELGCGNGRDSLYFASKGINVTAIDASDSAIKALSRVAHEGCTFVCGNFVDSALIYSKPHQYDFCYARFSFHAISESQEDLALMNIFRSLRHKTKMDESGKLLIEVRSIHDPLYGKGELVDRNSFVYDGHFRRFIDKVELESKLSRLGYIIEYSEERVGFAPFGAEDPPIIRVVASV